MSTATKRKTVALQLVPGRDSDLIMSIEKLPEGRRNQILKDVLRAGLGSPTRPSERNERLVEVERELADLRRALSDMPGWLEVRFSAVHQAIQGATLAAGQTPEPLAVAPLPRLNAEAKERRASKMDKAVW